MFFEKKAAAGYTEKEMVMIPPDDLTRRELADSERLRILRNAVMDSIIAIEETKRSFKSKKLEALRRELMRILAEVG